MLQKAHLTECWALLRLVCGVVGSGGEGGVCEWNIYVCVLILEVSGAWLSENGWVEEVELESGGRRSSFDVRPG